MWPKDVRKTDLRIRYFKDSGPGGQHKNKTESGVHMTHLPTGITAQATEHRSQHANKRLAFRRLAAKLVPLMKEAAVRSTDSGRPTERVRT